MKLRLPFRLLLAVLSCYASVIAAPLTWVGTSNLIWTSNTSATDNNWQNTITSDLLSYTTSLDDLTFNSAAASITLSGVALANSVNIMQATTINGGAGSSMMTNSVTLGSSLTISGGTGHSLGSISGSGTFNFNGTSLSAVSFAMGVLNVQAGTVTFSSTLTTGNLVTNAGTVTVTGNVNTTGGWTNTGTVTLNGSNNTVGNLANTGVMTLKGATSAGALSGAGTLNFSGTSLQLSSISAGTLNVTLGTATFTGSITGGTVNFSGTSLVATNMTAGTLKVNAGTASFSGGVTTANIITNAGNLTVAGSVSSAAGWTNSGAVTLNGATNSLGNVSNTGVLSLAGVSTIGVLTGAGTVNFSGTSLQVSGVSVGVLSTSAGSLTVTGVISGGTLNVGGTSLSATRMTGGTLTVNASATATFSGNISGGSIVNNAGTMTITGNVMITSTLSNTGTMNVNGAGPQSFAAVTNSGTLNLKSASVLDSISSSGVTGNLNFNKLDQNLTVTNGITNQNVTFTGLALVSSSMSGGSLTLSTSSSTAQIGQLTNTAVTNAGTLSFGATGLASSLSTLVNTGGVNVQGGTLSMGSLSGGGTLTVMKDAKSVVTISTVSSGANLFIDESSGTKNQVTVTGNAAFGTITNYGILNLNGDVTAGVIKNGKPFSLHFPSIPGSIVFGGQNFTATALTNNGSFTATSTTSPVLISLGVGSSASSSLASMTLTSASTVNFGSTGSLYIGALSGGNLNITQSSSVTLGRVLNSTNITATTGSVWIGGNSTVGNIVGGTGTVTLGGNSTAKDVLIKGRLSVSDSPNGIIQTDSLTFLGNTRYIVNCGQTNYNTLKTGDLKIAGNLVIELAGDDVVYLGDHPFKKYLLIDYTTLQAGGNISLSPSRLYVGDTRFMYGLENNIVDTAIYLVINGKNATLTLSTTALFHWGLRGAGDVFSSISADASNPTDLHFYSQDSVVLNADVNMILSSSVAANHLTVNAGKVATITNVGSYVLRANDDLNIKSGATVLNLVGVTVSGSQIDFSLDEIYNMGLLNAGSAGNKKVGTYTFEGIDNTRDDATNSSVGSAGSLVFHGLSLSSTFINGGNFQLTGGGTAIFGSATNVVNVTNGKSTTDVDPSIVAGTILVSGSASFGNVVNQANGMITVNGTTTSGTIVSNVGTINLNQHATLAAITSNTGSITIGWDATVQGAVNNTSTSSIVTVKGYTTINGDITNQGVMDFQDNSTLSNVTSNSGTIKLTDISTVNAITNTATGVINFKGNTLVASSISGGKLIVAQGTGTGGSGPSTDLGQATIGAISNNTNIENSSIVIVTGNANTGTILNTGAVNLAGVSTTGAVTNTNGILNFAGTSLTTSSLSGGNLNVSGAGSASNFGVITGSTVITNQGTMAVQGASTIGAVTNTGGTFNFSGTSLVGTDMVGGAVNIQSGTASLTSMSSNSSTSTAVGSSLAISGNASMGTLANNGSTSLAGVSSVGAITGAGLLSFGGSTLTASTMVGGSLTLSSAASTANFSGLITGGTAIVNQGKLNLNATTGTSSVSSITNTGSAAILTVKAGLSVSGDTVNTAGTLDLRGNTSLTTVSSNSGTIKLAGTSTIAGAVVNTGTGVLQFAGTSLAATSVSGGSLQVTSGTANFSGAVGALANPTTVTNAGTMNLNASGNVLGATTNSGTLKFLAGDSTIGAIVNTGGTLQFSGGTLTGTAGIQGGSLSITSGSVNFAGNLTNNTIISNAGNLTVAGNSSAGAITNTGTINLAGVSSASSISGATAGTVNFNGTSLTVSGAISNQTLNFTGTTLTGSTLSGGALNILSTGTTASFSGNISGSTLISNAGTLNINGGGANVIGATSNGASGVLNFNGGTLTGSTLDGGVINIRAGVASLTSVMNNISTSTAVGAVLNVSGNANLGALTNEGNTRLAGVSTIGSITAVGTGARLLIFNGTSLAVAGSISNSNINFTGTTLTGTTMSGGSLNINSGTGTFSGNLTGSISITNSGTLNLNGAGANVLGSVGNSGTLTIKGTNSTMGPVLNGGGTFNVAGTSLVGSSFSGGALNVQTGTMSLTSMSSATLTSTAVGTSLSISGNASMGALSNAGTVSLAGVSSVGAVTGAGTLNFGGTTLIATSMQGGALNLTSASSTANFSGNMTGDTVLTNAGILNLNGSGAQVLGNIQNSKTLNIASGATTGAINNTGNITLHGTSSTGAITGAGAIHFNGTALGIASMVGGSLDNQAGVVTLAGNMTGNTAVANAGTVNLVGTSSVGAVTGTGTLQFSGASLGIASIVGGALNNQAGTVTVASNIAGNTALTNAGTMNLSGTGTQVIGAVVNTGALTLEGMATMASLSGAGNTTFNGTSLSVLDSISGNSVDFTGTSLTAAGMSGGNLNIHSGTANLGVITNQANITNAGALMTKTGDAIGSLSNTGSVVLAGAGTIGTVSTTQLSLNGGTLSYDINGAANDFLSNTGNLTISANTVLNLSGLSTAGIRHINLMSYDSFDPSQLGNLSVNNYVYADSRIVYTIGNDNVNKVIYLDVAEGVATLTWKNGNTGTWGIKGAGVEWTVTDPTAPAITDPHFYNHDNIIFNEAGNNVNIALTGASLVTGFLNVNGGNIAMSQGTTALSVEGLTSIAANSSLSLDKDVHLAGVANQGTLSVAGSTVAGAITNTGTINLAGSSSIVGITGAGGTLNFNGVSLAVANAIDGQSVNFSGNTLLANSMNGGSLALNSATGTATFSGAVLGGTTMTNAGILNFNSQAQNTIGSLSNVGGTVNINGTALVGTSIDGGSLNLLAGTATFSTMSHNVSTATAQNTSLTITNGASMTSLSNAGTTVLNGTSQVGTVSGAGTLQANSGTLTLGSMDGGSLAVGSTAQVSVSGNMMGSTAINNEGSLELKANALVGAITGAGTLTFRGGSLIGQGMTGGNLNIVQGIVNVGPITGNTNITNAGLLLTNANDRIGELTNTGRLIIGGIGVSGTIYTGDLNLNGGSVVFDVLADANSNYIASDGSVTLGAQTTMQLNGLGNLTSNTTRINLIGYNSFTGNLTDFNLVGYDFGVDSSRITYTFMNDLQNKQIYLDVNGQAATLTWENGASGVWGVKDSGVEWTITLPIDPSIADNKFYNQDNVIFANTASIDLSTAIYTGTLRVEGAGGAPADVVLNTQGNLFRVTGDATIVAGNSLEVNGNALFSNIVNNGDLSLDGTSSTGSVSGSGTLSFDGTALNIANITGGALQIDSGAVTVMNSLLGATAITNSASGTLTVVANAVAGDIDNAGTIRFVANLSAGAINNTGTLNLAGVSTTGAVTGSGTTHFDGSTLTLASMQGGVLNVVAGSATVTGSVLASTDFITSSVSNISVTGSAILDSITNAGNVYLGNASSAHTVSGAGTLHFNGVSLTLGTMDAGTLDVQGGTVIVSSNITNGTALVNTSTVTVVGSANLSTVNNSGVLTVRTNATMGAVANTGTVNLAGTSSLDSIGSTGVAGTVNFAGTSLSVANTINNQTVSFTGASFVANSMNGGVLNLLSPTGMASFSGALTGSTVISNVGVLNLNGMATNTIGALTNTGGTVNVNGTSLVGTSIAGGSLNLIGGDASFTSMTGAATTSTAAGTILSISGDAQMGNLLNIGTTNLAGTSSVADVSGTGLLSMGAGTLSMGSMDGGTLRLTTATSIVNVTGDMLGQTSVVNTGILSVAGNASLGTVANQGTVNLHGISTVGAVNGVGTLVFDGTSLAGSGMQGGSLRVVSGAVNMGAITQNTAVNNAGVLTTNAHDQIGILENTGTLIVAGDGAIGSVNVTGLTLGGGTLKFDINHTGGVITDDYIVNSGTLSITGSTSIIIEQLDNVLAPIAPDTTRINLMSYSLFAGDLSNLRLGGIYDFANDTSRITYTLQNDTQNKQIYLSIDGEVVSLEWITGSDTWGVKGATEWTVTSPGSPALTDNHFYNLDNVSFAASDTVALAGVSVTSGVIEVKDGAAVNITGTDTTVFSASGDIRIAATGALSFDGGVKLADAINQGTLNLDGMTTVDDVSGAGTLNFSGVSLDVTSFAGGDLNILQGDASLGSIDTQGDVSVATAAELSLSGDAVMGSLTNTGTSSLTGTSIIGTIDNTGGVFNFDGDSLTAGDFAGGTLNLLSGEMNLVSMTGATDTTTGLGSILNITGDTVMGNLTNGSQVNLAGTSTVGSVSGAGTTTFDGTSLTMGSMAGGKLVNHAGTVSITGDMTGQTIVDNQGNLEISGSASTGTIANTGNIEIHQNATTGTINNQGTIDITGNAITNVLVNNGTVTIGGDAHTGTIVNNGSGAINLGGNSYVGGVHGNGTVNFDGEKLLGTGMSGGTLNNQGGTVDMGAISGKTDVSNAGSLITHNGDDIGSVINSGEITIAGDGSVGSISTEDLTLNAGGKLIFDVTGDGLTGQNDYIANTGSLTLTGDTTLNIKGLGNVTMGTDRLDLIGYDSFTGNLNQFVLEGYDFAADTSRISYEIKNDTTNKEIYLEITGSAATLAWKEGHTTWGVGDQGGDWDIVVSGSPMITDDGFYNLDNVIFAGNANVSLTTDITTGTFNVTGGNVVITTDGHQLNAAGNTSIAGGAGLTLDGSVNLVGVNNDGLLSLNGNSTTGSISGSGVTHFNGETLQIANMIGGTLAVESGSVSVTGNISGTTIINSGEVNLAGNSITGAITGNGTIHFDGISLGIESMNGGTLDVVSGKVQIDGSSNIATISGAGTTSFAGTEGESLNVGVLSGGNLINNGGAVTVFNLTDGTIIANTGTTTVGTKNGTGVITFGSINDGGKESLADLQINEAATDNKIIAENLQAAQGEITNILAGTVIEVNNLTVTDNAVLNIVGSTGSLILHGVMVVDSGGSFIGNVDAFTNGAYIDLKSGTANISTNKTDSLGDSIGITLGSYADGGTSSAAKVRLNEGHASSVVADHLIAINEQGTKGGTNIKAGSSVVVNRLDVQSGTHLMIEEGATMKVSDYLNVGNNVVQSGKITFTASSTPVPDTTPVVVTIGSNNHLGIYDSTAAATHYIVTGAGNTMNGYNENAADIWTFDLKQNGNQMLSATKPMFVFDETDVKTISTIYLTSADTSYHGNILLFANNNSVHVTQIFLNGVDVTKFYNQKNLLSFFSDYTPNMGKFVSNSTWAMFNSINQFTAAAMGQLGMNLHRMEHGYNIWGSGLYANENIGSAGGGGFTQDSGGYAIGVDALAGSKSIIGFALGQTFGTEKDKSADNKNKQDTFMMGIYGRTMLRENAKNSLALDYMLAGGEGWNNGTFRGTDGSSTQGQWDSRMWSVDVKGTWYQSIGKHTSLNPYIGLEYVSATSKGFTADGSMGKFDFSSSDARALRMPIGLTLQHNMSLGDKGMLSPYIGASYVPDLVRNNPSTNITNNTIAKDFSGTPIGRNAARMYGGATWQVNANWAINGHYEVETATDKVNQTGRITVSRSF